MAEVVEAAIEKQAQAIVEAGVGTGKTLAYLIPAILSGKRTVVSTATTNLQGQIINKDLPFIKEKLAPWKDVKYAIAKGKSHYVCGLAAEDAVADEKDPLKLSRRLQTFADEAARGKHSGDIAQLGEQAPEAWSRISAEECIGKHCKYYGSCGYIKARAAIKTANVVVANHSMVGLDLSLSSPTSPNPLLGTYNILVLDEAHKAIDYLRNAFAKSTKANAPDRAAQVLDKRGLEYNLVQFSKLKQLVQSFFSALPNPGKEATVPFEPATLGRHYISLAQGIELTAKEFLAPLRMAVNSFESRYKQAAISVEVGTAYGRPVSDDDRRDFFAYRRAVRRIEALMDAVKAVTPSVDDVTGKFIYDRSSVKYVRAEGERMPKELVVSPLQVAPYLQSALYKTTPTVIITSATLAIEGRFDDVKRDFGVAPPPKLELQVKSPFEYKKNALLYISRNVPKSPEDIRDPAQMQEYATAVATEIQALADIVHGGTFALFTSKKELEATYDVLARKGRGNLLRQETGVATEALVRRYLELARGGGKPLLLGLKSFWEGVSIEGSDLSCVIMVKLPFHPQSDPIHNALVAAAGENGFNGVVIPAMIRDVQQGAGRLIRTATDFGIVAILDPRLRTATYGVRVLNSLPFENRSTKLEVARAWYLKRLQASGSPTPETPKAA